MAEYSERDRRLTFKLVYYGPALSGKTTNLMRLHDIITPGGCGDLMSFETKGDRTLFFDLLPAVVRTRDNFTIKIKLFTVPGQVAHDATRKAVLSRADAVVFVADSQKNQAMSNFESFENLEKNAGRVGIDFDSLPLVVQFNKRDCPDITPEEEILDLWHPTGLDITFASALYGRGVRETFEAVLTRTYENLDRDYGLGQRHGVLVDDLLGVLPVPDGMVV